MLTDILKWIFKNFAPYLYGISVGIGFYILLASVLPILPKAPVLSWPITPFPFAKIAKEASTPPPSTQNIFVASVVPTAPSNPTGVRGETPAQNNGNTSPPPEPKKVSEHHALSKGKEDTKQHSPAQEAHSTRNLLPERSDTKAMRESTVTQGEGSSKKRVMSTSIATQEGDTHKERIISTSIATQEGDASKERVVSASTSAATKQPPKGATEQTAKTTERATRKPTQAPPNKPLVHKAPKPMGCGSPPNRPGRIMDRYLACQWRENCLSRLSRARNMIEQDKRGCPTSGANAQSCLSYYRALEQQYNPTLCGGWPALHTPRMW